MNLTKLKSCLLEAIFPQHCLNCQKPGAPFCYDCLSLIEINSLYFCAFCAKPNRVFKPGNCPKHQSKNLDGVFSAVSFNQPLVKKLIHNFKYPPYLKNLSAATVFLIIAHFSLTKNQIIWQAGENSVLMPAPIFKNKQKQRGFNHAEVLAQELAVHFKIPLSNNNLIKIKKTLPQMALNRKQRQENLKGAFFVKNPEAVQGKTIFLIDDVITTTSTMEEAAKVLKQAGAKNVWGIALAREPLQQ